MEGAEGAQWRTRLNDADVAIIVARAQTGHAPSLDRVLRLLQEPLWRHIHALVADADLADDVLQEVLWIIARRMSQLTDPRWFRAWAYRITTREALRRARAERRWRDALREETLAVLEMPEPDQLFDPEQIAATIAEIDALSPASALVMRLHYVDGLTLPEIAESLEIPAGTVKSRVAYGLTVLRKKVRVD
jgi:RNA polymerase sigma-70 factor (ECF subfamily)